MYHQKNVRNALLFLILLAAACTLKPSLPTGEVTSLPTASETPIIPASSAIVLEEQPGGLALVSAPAAIPLLIGHVTYLAVEIQGQHRPVTVHAQTLIHTFVNDLTPAEPGASPAYEVALLEAGQSELKLQTLRMRPHELTLTFTAGESAISVSLALQPAIQPHTPLFGTFYVPNRMTPPYELVYGPDCGACPTTPGDPPGTTRDRACYRDLADPCRCHYYQWVYDADADERARASAPQMQIFATQFLRNTWAVWGNTEVEPGNYLWSALDWVYTRENLSSLEQDCSPLLSDVMYGSHGWFSCPEYANPDGSNGFYDVDNAFMLEHFRAYMRALNTRYAAELRFIEMGNEPAAEFYLCPCSAPLDIACDASSGPNQPVCEDGPGSTEFAAVYGDLLFTAADIAAEEMAAVNPHALLITGALEMVPTRDTHLTATTEYLIQQGLLENDNVAIGIHQYPYFYPPPWLRDENGSWLNCGYYQPGQDIFWLPDGCETAPPFTGDFAFPSRTAPEKTFTARDLWQRQDERVDLSGLLHDAEALGVLDEIYFFDTELHAGFHDGDPTTSPAREALAGLRIAAINSHQRVIGTEFIFAPGDPAVFNLLVKNLSGVTPIYAWDAPLMDADYSGIVYKLFTRGDEDILAIWSNAEADQWLVFSLHENSTQFKQVTLTTFWPTGEADNELGANIVVDVSPPADIQVHPIEEFHFLSVISDRPGFGWLANISTASESPPAVTALLVPDTPPAGAVSPTPAGEPGISGGAALIPLALLGLIWQRASRKRVGK